MEPVSLPPLVRLRLPSERALEALARLQVLLIETLPAAARAAELPPATFLGLLSVEPGASPIPGSETARVLGPAVRLGSERALLLELAARAGGAPEAVRWLQLATPAEIGEVLASLAVAAELEALGARITGGPSPPVLGPRGELLTRI